MPDVVNLFPNANTSMVSILKSHGNFVDGKPTNMLVVFHLDGCVFCEMTLGTIMYNFKHENIFRQTGVQPYQILVSPEGEPVVGHTYCQGSPSCIKEANEVLGINVSAITDFPTEYFYDANGKVKQVGNMPCGIAVRGDADRRCTSKDLTYCSEASIELDNWVCNMYSGKPSCSECTCDDWKRCQSPTFALAQVKIESDDCTHCCGEGQWFWASCCTNSSIKYLDVCPAKCCQPSECCGAYGYPKDVWDPTCCHAAGNSMPDEDSRCKGTCPKSEALRLNVVV